MTSVAMPHLARAVLEFWFADALASPQHATARSKLWFSYDREFDAEIERRFGELPPPKSARSL